jgi:hypothetical protein
MGVNREIYAKLEGGVIVAISLVNMILEKNLGNYL